MPKRGVGRKKNYTIWLRVNALKPGSVSHGLSKPRPIFCTSLADDAATRRCAESWLHTPHTSPRTLWPLADDDDLDVRQAIAFNANSPSELLAHLAGKSIDFALLVALNPGIPAEVLDQLTTDGDALVQFVSTVARADRALGSGDENPHPRTLELRLDSPE